jgi:hypothetical protein
MADNNENEALIQEMLRDAQKAEVDSDLIRNPVIHKGDEDLAAPMTVKEMTSAGYVWIFDTRTGERVPCIYYMIAQKLRTKRPDGSFRFTTSDPGFRPKHGTIKCMLHPEHENREHYDELGFRTCKKDNITNPYQLAQHMKKKHPQEWEAIEAERAAREKEEDRALQRLLLAQQLGKMEAEPLSDAPQSKSEGFTTKGGKLVCPHCGADFTNKKVFEKHVADCDK